MCSPRPTETGLDRPLRLRRPPPGRPKRCGGRRGGWRRRWGRARGGRGRPRSRRGGGRAGMRAQAMDESLAVPTATSFRTVAVDTLDAKRKALNGTLKERGMKVSFTHLVARAIVQADRKSVVQGK